MIKYSKNINHEKPINPLVVAEKLQHIYHESFDIFNELILKPTEIKSKTIDSYRSVSYTHLTLPTIYSV